MDASIACVTERFFIFFINGLNFRGARHMCVSVCERLAQGRYPATRRPGVELATWWSQVLRRGVNGGGMGGCIPPSFWPGGIQCLSSPPLLLLPFWECIVDHPAIACRGHRSFQTFCIARSPTGFAYLVSSRSVAYLGGGLVRGPPPLWPDRRDFLKLFWDYF